VRNDDDIVVLYLRLQL